MEARARDQARPFAAKDGSTVRELMHPSAGGARGLSLAEATVPPGGETAEHLHPRAEEIYHVTAGAGRIRVGGEEREIVAGDSVLLPPGVAHKLWNPGPAALVLLCACAPPYADGDTVLAGG